MKFEKLSRYILFNVYHFTSKFYTFLFRKPKIKVGDKLNYYNKTCQGMYFNWKYGTWFLVIQDNLSISYKLEKAYKEKKYINN